MRESVHRLLVQQSRKFGQLHLLCERAVTVAQKGGVVLLCCATLEQKIFYRKRLRDALSAAKVTATVEITSLGVRVDGGLKEKGKLTC